MFKTNETSDWQSRKPEAGSLHLETHIFSFRLQCNDKYQNI
jgi:hypothetical protein